LLSSGKVGDIYTHDYEDSASLMLSLVGLQLVPHTTHPQHETANFTKAHGSMDPLSLTANLAAVIGLIDTICRIGKETYQLIAAVKNVPAEIQQLQVEMHEVEFLLENVHRYCDEYQERLPSMSLQKTSPVMHIYSTLQSLEKEYDNIAAIVAKNLDAVSSRTRQKLKMVGGRVKLVLGGKLERSFRNLDRCKRQLSMNLQVLGR
jgi:hypothetical protein